MRALTILPGTPGSLRLEQFPEPPAEDGDVLVATRAIGLCGTDREISAGSYGSAPPGAERLILGHESIGQVLEAPPDSDFAPGDWVVGIVRRPDPVPCPNCAMGEWDMCRNGLYTEHGIRGRQGFASDRYRIQSQYLVKVSPELGLLGVLLEPTSIVAKAWDQIARIGARALGQPRTVLVTGAGSIGLLAALMGTQRGLDVHVFDRIKEGPKPQLVRQLGATYHSGALEPPSEGWDVVIECTGAAELLFEAIQMAARNGIVCLTGISAAGRVLKVNAAALNRELVLENNVVFGTVNANRAHYEQAADSLAMADHTWLESLISRRLPIEQFADGFAHRPEDVKTTLFF